MRSTDLRCADRRNRRVQCGDRTGVVCIAQHRQQAALEIDARGGEFGRFPAAHRGIGGDQPRHHGHGEQVRRMNPFRAAHFEQRAIIGIQVQRLLRFPEQQFVEVFGDRGERRGKSAMHVGVEHDLPASDALEQLLRLAGDRRDSGNIDDRQRAVRLVQRCARGREHRRIAIFAARLLAGAVAIATGAVFQAFAQALRAGRERIADLADAPRQRGEIGLVVGGAAGVVVDHRRLTQP